MGEAVWDACRGYRRGRQSAAASRLSFSRRTHQVSLVQGEVGPQACTACRLGISYSTKATRLWFRSTRIRAPKNPSGTAAEELLEVGEVGLLGESTTKSVRDGASKAIAGFRAGWYGPVLLVVVLYYY